MPYSILITGSNRGIGLELVKQYADAGWLVLACCRKPEQAVQLKKLQESHSNIDIYALDVCNIEQAEQLKNKLNERTIDVFINNAGILGARSNNLNEIDMDEMQTVYQVNAIAPLKMLECFLPLIEKSARKQIVQISSSLASISENHSGGYYAYRASKAAVNMLMKSAAVELVAKEIKVLMLDPGWVKTDMGGPNADIDVETSVLGLRKMIDTYQHETGIFYRYNGVHMRW